VDMYTIGLAFCNASMLIVGISVAFGMFGSSSDWAGLVRE
jgi:hypothetical protein